MSYISLNYTFTTPAEDYIDINLVHDDDTTFVKKHILARGAHILLTPVSFITSAVDTIIGLGAGIGAICTLGTHKQTFNVACYHLSSSKELFVLPYVNFVQTINPEARFSEAYIVRYLGLAKKAMISGDGVGFLSDFVINPLKNIARSCYNSDNFLTRHVASRLTYALLAVSCLVTRAVDGIIGIPAAALSILTVGKFESLNNLAYRTLQAPGIIGDLFYCTIKFINPWTGTSEV